MGSIKAIALISGGLDSKLSTKIIKDMGVDIIGLNFYTGFCIVEQKRRIGRKGKDGELPRNEALKSSSDIGIPLEIIDISEEYLKMVVNPKFGYGANVNPCIDCRIYMLREAKRLMEEKGASFVVTGEVLGERPMSQNRKALDIVENESDLKGLILRPLSAKLLSPTLPEINRWVDRDKLYSIQGRSRKEQMKLAKEFGIEEYPQPAGGCCFLTDENYARRFRDLLAHKGVLTHDDVILLSVGRHFRISEGLKIIVGRNEGENNLLERYKRGRYIFKVNGFPGPLTLAEGIIDREEEKRIISAITVRYSDCKNNKGIEVILDRDGVHEIIKIDEVYDISIEEMRI
jgi:tRNA U34 2-thiouridine synthase MnmA/TrmU